MPIEDLARLVDEGLYLAIYLSAPAMLTALAVGAVVAVLGAATQVQEPSASYVPKLIGVALALALSGTWMAAELVEFTQQLWLSIPALSS
jgi:flagellar biosynthetic protein FliQ